MKRGTLDHWKTQLLARKLNLHGRFRVAGILEALWHFTALYAPTGAIGTIPPAAVAAWIGYKDANRLMAALQATRWIDGSGTAALIHDWPDHCEDSVHMRLARAHLHFADGSTPHLTRLGRAERQKALQFYAANPPPRSPAGSPKPPYENLRSKSNGQTIETLTKCLQQYDLTGWQRVLEWARQHPEITAHVDACWRILAFGRSTNRRASRGGVRDPARLWISSITNAKYAPPDGDFAEARRCWERLTTQTLPNTAELATLIAGIGGPTHRRPTP